MHIKRRQRYGTARIQVDIAFLTTCRIDFFTRIIFDEYTRLKQENTFS